MFLQTQLLTYPLFNKGARSGCFSRLSFIFQRCPGARWLPSCMKILLTVRMCRTVALNHNVKNIRNDVQQIIIILSLVLLPSIFTGCAHTHQSIAICRLHVSCSTYTSLSHGCAVTLCKLQGQCVRTSMTTFMVIGLMGEQKSPKNSHLMMFMRALLTDGVRVCQVKV